MISAAFWGAIAGSAVFIGALLGLYFPIDKRIIGLIMAFGTGVLIGAASFELLEHSITQGGIFITAGAFLTGAFTFTIFDLMIAKGGGKERKRSKENPINHAGLAIFIGTIIDAIPESVMLGVSLIKNNSVSLVLVIAIFISNFPEGLSSSIGLVKDGYTKKKILILWSTVLILSSISSLAGYVFLRNSSEALIAGIGAYAAGGIVSMVSSTMMPEAYEEGGPVIGLLASIGLMVSFILTK